MKANWKLFLPRLLPSKLLVFRCESEEKTFHDKPPKLISMKEGYLHELVYAQSLALTTSAFWLCLPIHEKHASLVPKKRISDNSVNRLANNISTFLMSAANRAKRLFLKERFTLFCVRLIATQFWENNTRKLPQTSKPENLLLFSFPMSRSFRRKGGTRKLYSNDESFELLLLLPLSAEKYFPKS